MKWKLEVVRQRVGRSHGQNRQGDSRIYQDLGDVVDGAIAPADENRVATGVDGPASFIRPVTLRLRGHQVGLHAAAPERCQRGFQFPLASLAAAGIRVVKQRGLAHGVVEAGLYLSGMRAKRDAETMISGSPTPTCRIWLSGAADARSAGRAWRSGRGGGRRARSGSQEIRQRRGENP